MSVNQAQGTSTTNPTAAEQAGYQAGVTGTSENIKNVEGQDKHDPTTRSEREREESRKEPAVADQPKVNILQAVVSSMYER